MRDQISIQWRSGYEYCAAELCNFYFINFSS